MSDEDAYGLDVNGFVEDDDNMEEDIDMNYGSVGNYLEDDVGRNYGSVGNNLEDDVDMNDGSARNNDEESLETSGEDYSD